MIRTSYVRGVQGAARVCDRIGVERWLADTRGGFGRHLCSLLAVYDVQRMVRLDLPWWTYPAIREVEQFLADRHGQARVFEYGSGASTVWLSRRAGEVVSVEHDLDFLGTLAPLTEPFDNVRLLGVPATPRRSESVAVSGRAGYEHLDFGDYASSLRDEGGTFDLIVVDGRARVACLAAAVDHLAAGGVVLFDNATRDRYRPALETCGLRVDLHRGWAPCLPYRDATAVLRHRP